MFDRIRAACIAAALTLAVSTAVAQPTGGGGAAIDDVAKAAETELQALAGMVWGVPGMIVVSLIIVTTLIAVRRIGWGWVGGVAAIGIIFFLVPAAVMKWGAGVAQFS